jgi:hypothetical protein
LAVLSLVSVAVAAALGLAGLVVAVVTAGSAGGLVLGFLSAAIGFGALGLVSVLLDLLGVFRDGRQTVDPFGLPEGRGRRRQI